MKKLVLIVALLLPVAIFIFLKFFGKNEFTIPVYYESGVEHPPAGCNRSYDVPYLVSDSLLNSFDWRGKPVLVVADASGEVQGVLTHLDDRIREEIQTIYLSGKDDYLDTLFACDLLLQPPWKMVLIDDQRRIRGYYDPEDREEIDRLTVELKILLKQY